MDHQTVLGLDIGSVSISAVILDADGRLLRSSYRFHKGKVREALVRTIRELDPGVVSGVGITASSPRLIRGAREIDGQVCLITACRRFFESMGAILYVGGERFGLIRFDEGGAYVGTRVNSSCAAGTGSFLDQQARRLGLDSSAELASTALRSTGEPPRISTRCAVFARTDLVHAQQAGYGREEICDGLCRGLAQNIADTLLGGEKLLPPVIFAGGVAANEAVRRHVEGIFGVPVLSHESSPLLGAMGAALGLIGEASAVDDQGGPLDLHDGVEALLADDGTERASFYAPLSLERSSYPAGASVQSFRQESGRFCAVHPVEVEVYRELGGPAPGGEVVAWLGIDVGSTSTKAMITDSRGEPLVGLYTRTLGRPVSAAQALLEVVSGLQAEAGVRLRFAGVATTGAGRKFVGKILGADLVVDEITAHARAATELVPDVDTIIEIGGQDAKFTTLRDGRVTFAHMNTVCAAGTGSFIEEQALRLGCDLADYAKRVEGVRAPLVSDRCAVFMERDINDLLNRGFTTEEILASCLFAVRENYLQKVARGVAIGERVCFQGATARNRALVAAFEQGIGKPIFVSPYCHLTGGLGAALLAREQRGVQAGVASSFRGLEVALRDEIPIRSETCKLCTNHCRLRIAEINGEALAYGFLCGRDYDTRRYVNANRSGFDLLAERRRAFAWEPAESVPARSSTVIGIPAALALYEELPLWKRFFGELRIPVVTSEGIEDSVSRGKNLQGAEFCAPLAALHGHAAYLSTRSDHVFLPVHFSERHEGARARRAYCYYTQFAPALVSAAEGLRGRCLMPVAALTTHRDQSVREIHAALVGAGIHVGEDEVEQALEHAIEASSRAGARLRDRFREEMAGAREPSVVLVGRPYTILSPEMNKGIPGIFGTLGVKVFSQDMVSYERGDVAEIEGLLNAFHWHYAARILEVALVAAKTPLLYPVFVTSFKCSPDSFAVEYFKRILDERGKPYLVLQLDDHDSSMGYETRIEAGVRAFRNHASAPRPAPRSRRRSLLVPRVDHKLDGRTLLLPPWDSLVIPLIAAALQREGVDARVIEETPLSIRKAMRHNTGQCIPLNVIAEEAVDYVERHGLDPGRTALWMPKGGLACNFPLFPPFIQSLFESRGNGIERMSVYSCDLTFVDFGPRAALHAYRAALVGGTLRRVGCRLRPYEVQSGATNRAIGRAMEILVPAFADGSHLREAVGRAASCFDPIATLPARKPKVAIFGDLYVRDNDVMSQDLIRSIEDAGGEVISTSIVEYYRIVMGYYYRKWLAARDFHNFIVTRAVWTMMERTGRPYSAPFERFLGPSRSDVRGSDEWILEQFGVRSEHAGESFDNLLKVFHIWREHPDLRLFVQANPAFCCPSLVTEAMARDIRRVTGVPVVSLTYDGTGQYRNDAIVPYLRYARELETGRRVEPLAGMHAVGPAR